ncbi:protein NLRC3-like, partial [Sinocyclocheilus rhinocerous]|uniref:protein NLRC3-like n=1 Tax=Sinocyclocheilus rhinocerous TaxID=307959 RepID=UPI0007B9E4BE
MLQKFLQIHKTNMKKKAKYIFEGNKENDTDLETVYTELFITEGEMKDVNHEHEILKIDDAFMNKKTQDKPIKCNDIFTELRKNNEEKIVLTKGVAGIGKTVSVHKFILDWAEENTNQDIDCVFLLPFREINMIKNREVNLHEFLLKFYPGLKNLEKSKLYKECKLAFIFDGLDESRLPLNFKSETLDTFEERSSVDVLFTSLVKGKLLPSALVWVTSRPAAANQIPGVAGIGKTVSVHKFILDWAAGDANQNIHCVLLLPFREMNLMTNEDFSLHELLLEFYPELEGLEKTKLYKECNLAFIFDGLDESQLPLNFKSDTLDTVEERASVDVLFTSLVK